MDFSQYGITLETIGRWFILGFGVGYFLTRFDHTYLPLRSAFYLAITISILLLVLLLVGFIDTIIGMLSFGSGILFFLLSVLLRNLFLFLLLGRFPKNVQRNF